MKLEVGMYVRTKWGITKIVDISYVDKTIYYVDACFQPIDETKCYREDIEKASHNLLGNDKEPCLIEVGDYVNGSKVININGNLFVNGEGALEYIVIKSIVTCEQFASMEYKVGE